MRIIQQLLTPNKFTRPGLALKNIDAIAIHFTGDPGATAQNIHDYFQGSCREAGRYASCHFTVGIGGEIIQLIPESEWAYCTNAANSHTLSIETCHPDSTGKFTAATEKSLIELAAALCQRHGLNPLKGGLIRHYDVTGKECPLYYVRNPNLWAQFKQAVADCMVGKPYTLPSYGTTVGYSPAVCDTTHNFNLKRGATYQFGVMSATQPALTPGSGSLKLVTQSHSGGMWYFKFQAVGKVGDGAGMYLNGAAKPLLVVTII